MKPSQYRYLKDVAKNGEFLAAWLNECERMGGDTWGYDAEICKRTISLLERIQELRTGGKEPVDQGQIAAIDELLGHYPWVLRASVAIRGNSRTLSFYQFPAPGAEHQGQTWLKYIVQLMGAGVLDRLRRCCHCRKWFYANRPKKRYCSKAHYLAHYRAIPEHKKENRKYQHKYYKDHFSAKAVRRVKPQRGKSGAKKR